MFIVIHMRFAVCVFQKSPGIGPQTVFKDGDMCFPYLPMFKFVGQNFKYSLILSMNL